MEFHALWRSSKESALLMSWAGRLVRCWSGLGNVEDRSAFSFRESNPGLPEYSPFAILNYAWNINFLRKEHSGSSRVSEFRHQGTSCTEEDLCSVRLVYAMHISTLVWRIFKRNSIPVAYACVTEYANTSFLNILYFSILLHSFNTEYLFFCPSM
jgi:hypothetical protein